jgi:hypothetical protein
VRTLIILGVVIPLLSAAAHSEPAATFYGRDGSYQGTVHTYGNQRTFTNTRGEFIGSSITHGNTTAYFDNAGKFQGTSSRAREAVAASIRASTWR